jgi:flagellar biosynthetic protein FliP
MIRSPKPRSKTPSGTGESAGRCSADPAVPAFARRAARLLLVCFALGALFTACANVALAQNAAGPGMPLIPRLPGVSAAKSPQDVANTLVILFLLTVLSLAPAILILMTPFLRISIVLSMLRQALGTPQIPPTQVILGLSLFLTFSILAPQLREVNERAVQPYLAGKMAFGDALDRAARPMRRFMIKQTYKKDLGFFIQQAKLPAEGTAGAVAQDRLPMTVVIPAFVISELKTAFLLSFFIYVPFLIIDLVVAALLMSMGMMMLPPTVISLPAKILVFVLADGWNLVIGSLAASFQR